MRAVDYSNPNARLPGNTCGGDPHYLCLDVGSNAISMPVTPGDSYVFWVHACNANGCSNAPSANFYIRPATPLATPANLTTTCNASGTQATFSWSAVPGAGWYAPRLHDLSVAWFTPPNDWLDNAYPTTTYTANITPNQAYGFWVHAGRAGEWSGYAINWPFTCVPTALPPLATPTNLTTTCSADATQVTFTWGAVSGAEAYAPRLDYLEDGWYNPPRDWYSQSYPSTSYTTSITPNKPYAFWVHARRGPENDIASYSGYSINPSFTCVATPPEPTSGYIGSVDTLNNGGDGVVRGWVCDQRAPNAQLGVLIYRNGRYVGRTTTYTDYRPDVPNAGFCSGNVNSGWRFELPDEEYDGRSSFWEAKVATPSEPSLNHAMTSTGITALIPAKQIVNYVQPRCFQPIDAAFSMGKLPGEVLDRPVATWAFNTKINDARPNSPVSTWNGGVYTGTHIPLEWRGALQIGDARSNGSELLDTQIGRSMHQLTCTSAGLMLNNFWLDTIPNEEVIGGAGAFFGTTFGFRDDPKLKISTHTRSLIAEFQPGRINAQSRVNRPFATPGASLVFAGDIVIPAFYIEQHGANTPVGQANFYTYFWDTQSGNVIGYVMGIWATGASLNTTASIGFDGYNIFVSHPTNSANGLYASWEAGFASSGQTFSADRTFRARISREQLLNAINQANTQYGAGFSTNPENYLLTDALFGIEAARQNVSIGASVRNFHVYMAR